MLKPVTFYSEGVKLAGDLFLPADIKPGELKTMNQGTALATGTLALPPLVIEGLEDFKGSFDRLCLQGWDCSHRGDACG